MRCSMLVQKLQHVLNTEYFHTHLLKGSSHYFTPLPHRLILVAAHSRDGPSLSMLQAGGAAYIYWNLWKRGSRHIMPALWLLYERSLVAMGPSQSCKILGHTNFHPSPKKKSHLIHAVSAWMYVIATSAVIDYFTLTLPSSLIHQTLAMETSVTDAMGMHMYVRLYMQSVMSCTHLWLCVS